MSKKSHRVNGASAIPQSVTEAVQAAASDSVRISEAVLPMAAKKIADERIALLRGIQDRIAKAKVKLGETDFKVAQAEGDRQAARAGLAEALRALETFANTEAEAMGLLKDGRWNFDIEHAQFTRI